MVLDGLPLHPHPSGRSMALTQPPCSVLWWPLLVNIISPHWLQQDWESSTICIILWVLIDRLRANDLRVNECCNYLDTTFIFAHGRDKSALMDSACWRDRCGKICSLKYYLSLSSLSESTSHQSCRVSSPTNGRTQLGKGLSSSGHSSSTCVWAFTWHLLTGIKDIGYRDHNSQWSL